MKKTTEIWKDIPGYEGYYQASDLGKVKSIKIIVKSIGSRTRDFTRTLKSYILRPDTDKDGYLYVRLCKDNKIKKFAVAKLVLITFKRFPKIGEEICHHPDNTPSNNRLDNLQWGTRAENVKHKIINGTILKGAQIKASKLNDIQVKEILLSIDTNYILAKKYNVSKSTIERIKNKKGWKHVTI